VLTLNAAAVDPAVTVTFPGTFNDDSPLVLSATTAPPAGAAFDNVTVQLLVALGPNVVGLHWRDETTTAAASVRFTFCDVPL
jgi:hypothetical protein